MVALFLPQSFDFSIMGHLTKCQKCGRKMIIEVGQAGVNHDTNIWVTCAECTKLEDEFRVKFPKVAEFIEK